MAWAQVSPDDKTVIFARGHNLFMMDAENYKLAQADFVTVLYNVQSRCRQDGVYRILRILLDHKSPDTCCGVVRNAYRDGQEHYVCTLLELLDRQFDMLTTIIVSVLNVVSWARPESTPIRRMFSRPAPVHGGPWLGEGVGSGVGVGLAAAGVGPASSQLMRPVVAPVFPSLELNPKVCW
jgi:precorrin-3B C17-methyltransferase